MKRKFTFLMAAFMLLAFLAVPMGMRGQVRETAGFSLKTVTQPPIAANANPATGTITGTDSDWNVEITGEFSSSSMQGSTGNKYWQMGKKDSPITSASFSTDDISGTITNIVVNCAAYNGNAKVSATVNGNAFGTQNQNAPSWSNNSGGDITFSGSAAGEIVVSLSATNSARAIYIQSITVTYASGGGPEITSLTYTGTPDKTEYEAGESFDPTGLTVTATYSDQSTQNVTDDVVWTPDPLTAGVTSVIGTYSSLTITVNGLTVVTPPDPNVVLDKTNSPFSSTSSSNTSVGTKTLDGIEYQNYGGYVYSNNYLSFNRNLEGAYLGNNTVLCGNIKKIVIDYNTGGASLFTMYEGASALAETTTVAPSSTGTGTVTYTFSGDNGYFKLKLTTTGTYCNINSISIYLKECNTPAVTVNPSSLSFAYVAGTPENELPIDNVTIEGNNLTQNVVVSLPSESDFELSEDLDIWGTSATLVPVNNSLTNVDIAVRLKEGKSIGSYNGSLSVNSSEIDEILVTLTGEVTTPTHTIEQYSSPATAHGTITFDPVSPVPEGATVTMTATPNEGYEFTADSWVFYNAETLDPVALNVTNGNKIVMPNYNLAVDATFNHKTTYKITLESNPVSGGEIVTDMTDDLAYEGQTVTLSYTASTGYYFMGIDITKTSDGAASGITPTASGDDFTFVMPAYPVTVTATFVSNTFEGTFVLFEESTFVEGDYLLVYDNKAMNNDNSTTSNKLKYVTVAPEDGVVTNPERGVVWHIAPSETSDYWTIYNAIANKYVSGVGNSTDVRLVANADADGAKWKVSGTTTRDFQCKANEEQNTKRYIRYYASSSVYGNYASSNGGPLSLYKYTVLTERTITFNGNGGTYNDATTYTQTVYGGIATNLNANRFSKDNATFLGWATTADGEVVYADEDEITTTVDLTLYAKWQSSHTLTIDSPNAEVLVFVDGNNDPIEFVSNEARISDGLTLYASIDPYDCYTFGSIAVTYGDNQTVTLNEETPGVYYSFTMPSDNATLTVTTTDIPVHTLTIAALNHASLDLIAGNSSFPVQSGDELCEGILVTVVATIEEGYTYESLTVVYGNNEQAEVTTVGTNTFVFEMPTSDATLTFTTCNAATYTLVTDASQIVSGKHYVIASGKEGTCRVMGAQAVTNNGSQGNNRTSVEATVTNNSITGTTGIYELVINGPETITINQNDVEVYTIYDAQYPGYLYAASGTSNHLKTRPANLDANSQWTIGIAATTSVATIKAQGGNSRNWMRNNSNIFACYSSGQSDIYLFVKDGDTDFEYYGSEITYTDNDIPDGTTITVGTGSVMTVDNNFENTDSDKLIIEDGGQLIHTADVNATMLKDITGYGDDNTVTTGWYTIASPVAAANIGIAAAGTYDLYKYDEKNVLWLNQELPENNTLFASFNQGVGYLYGNAAGVELQFAGEMVGTSTEITVPLSCSATNVNLQGFNLVGNPFTRNLVAGDVKILEAAMTSYYYVAGGSELSSALIGERPIKPGEGFFVQTSAAGNLVLNPSSKGSRGMDKLAYVRIEAGNDNHKDQAFIQIGQGNTLNKMTINDNVAHVSVQNNNAEYAVATIEEAHGEMPVNFKAAENGTYTIDVEAENLEVNYLHLIDNLTGMDVDLLATPSYTFEARKSDIASRFRLVFDANTGNDETNDNFAFINNGELIVNGNGTVQVIDILGRQMFSHEVNSAFRIQNSSFAPGVYVLRLVNGNDVKTQKIVIK